MSIIASMFLASLVLPLGVGRPSRRLAVHPNSTRSSALQRRFGCLTALLAAPHYGRMHVEKNGYLPRQTSARNTLPRVSGSANAARKSALYATTAKIAIAFDSAMVVERYPTRAGYSAPIPRPKL